MPTLWLLRHGETQWSLAGRHTGRTDVALTARGELQAAALGRHLGEREFALVLTSPLSRAADTCRLAGYAGVAERDDDLLEWDYGAFEGKTTREIRTEHPVWTIWNDGALGGEMPDDVARRTDRVIARVKAANGDVALFAHGHLLRTLAARWLDLPPRAGGSLTLDTASVSVLGVERERCVIQHWNEICHLAGE
ncbi:MAG: histidine phosphatase family protein [Gemmatimonadaceae bacterium]